jgi:transketolase
MRDTFIRILTKLTTINENIILLTGDLGFGVLDDFSRRFPKNYLNVGVAEQNMTGIAAGLALEGRIVFTYSIANFPTLRCLEQIRNDICYHDLNVNIISIGGGFSYGQLGMSHHATEDLSIMRSLPNLLTIAPTGLWETKEATKAIINNKSASYLRLDKSAGDDLPNDDENSKYTIGKARLLRKGKDCTIIVAGGILEEVIEAVNFLEKKNISASIISMHTINPIDKDSIMRAYDQTNAIITVEEHALNGGLGSAVAECLFDAQLNNSNRKFLRIALENKFSSIVGDQKYLRKIYKMDSKSIYERILNLLTS